MHRSRKRLLVALVAICSAACSSGSSSSLPSRPAAAGNAAATACVSKAGVAEGSWVIGGRTSCPNGDTKTITIDATIAALVPPSTTPTTAASPTTVAPTSTTTTPAPPGLIFDDEFNGTTLDLSKWQPNWLGPNNQTITKPINGSETSCYDPAQVSVAGGNLQLTATSRSCKANNGTTYAIASGLVESLNHFTFTYGHLEARMYLPPGSGAITNWPAFWADGTGSWPATGELDVMEGLHGQQCFHFHSPAGGPGSCVTAPNGNPSGWHTFGATWSAGQVFFFYDGKQVGAITSGITNAPMYVIFNLATGGESGPQQLPATALVDYVRVWK